MSEKVRLAKEAGWRRGESETLRGGERRPVGQREWESQRERKGWRYVDAGQGLTGSVSKQ